jgi:hypothetical protein
MELVVGVWLLIKERGAVQDVRDFEIEILRRKQ